MKTKIKKNLHYLYWKTCPVVLNTTSRASADRRDRYYDGTAGKVAPECQNYPPGIPPSTRGKIAGHPLLAVGDDCGGDGGVWRRMRRRKMTTMTTMNDSGPRN